MNNLIQRQNLRSP